jgi:hypothetical protein
VLFRKQSWFVAKTIGKGKGKEKDKEKTKIVHQRHEKAEKELARCKSKSGDSSDD